YSDSTVPLTIIHLFPTRRSSDLGTIKKISSFYTSVGVLDEFMTLYLATDLTPVENKLPQDRDEQLVLEKVTLDEALKMIDEGQRSEEHTSELQSRFDLVCRLLLE